MRYVSLIALIGIPINSIPLTLSKNDAKKIGMQVWKNEASQKEDLLVFWNKNEAFPSLGICHAIWLPAESNAPYTEQFPALCTYLQKNGVKLPHWLDQAKNTGAPWKSRLEFLNDTKKTSELKSLLTSTIELQTHFMLEQLYELWPQIIQEAPRRKRAAITKNFNLLQTSLLGLYALVDYLNFKGAGINPREECNGCRWGLLQVLSDMPDNLNEETVLKAFTVSAAKILLGRIENSAPLYTHLTSMPGWIKRVHTYSDQSCL